MKLSQYYLLLILLFTFTSCSLKNGRNICDDENKADYQESVSHFKGKVETNPQDQAALNYLAMSYYKLAEYEEAEVIFTSLLEVNREYQAAYLNRGLCRFFQANQTGACEDFKNSVNVGFDPAAIEGEKISVYVQKNCAS